MGWWLRVISLRLDAACLFLCYLEDYNRRYLFLFSSPSSSIVVAIEYGYLRYQNLSLCVRRLATSHTKHEGEGGCVWCSMVLHLDAHYRKHTNTPLDLKRTET